MKPWLLAIRPKTLGISVAPVITGSALAWNVQRALDWPIALAALAAALLIQIGTNLHNDAADFERGADTPERLGPERATAQGWFTAQEVKAAALGCFAGAFILGVPLAWIGGWPIVIMGLLSLAAGYGYTGGPRPIAYTPSGELFVFLFFGLFAVLGSYYLQTLHIGPAILATAVAIGCLAAAVLLVNNYRDLETDEKASKLTLVHYLGRERARRLYTLLLLAPFILPPLLHHLSPGVWLTLALLPLAMQQVQQFLGEPVGSGFNRLLAQTARLQLLFSLLLSIGLVL